MSRLIVPTILWLDNPKAPANAVALTESVAPILLPPMLADLVLAPPPGETVR